MKKRYSRGRSTFYGKLRRAYRTFTNPRFRARMAIRKYRLTNGRFPGSKFSIRQQRSQIGLPKNKATSRTHVNTEPPSGSTSRLFNLSLNLTDVPATGTPDQTTTGRISNRIYISGFKLCVQCNLLAQAGNRAPFVFNFAVVSAKRQATPSSANFLRGHNQEEGIDLDTARSGLQLSCAEINTDLYSVLLHKRIRLYNYNTTDTPNNARYANYGPTHIWVPLKRQISFENAGATPNTGVYLVHWGDYCDTPNLGGTLANSYDFQCRAITYFRNLVGG